MKELTEAPAVNAYRARFECHRGFDLDDDMEFIPGLLSDDDVSFHLLQPPTCYATDRFVVFLS